MSVLLSCDAPGCDHTKLAIAYQGKPTAPTGWWMQVSADGQLVVACCDKHLPVAAAIVAKRRPQDR